MRILVTGSRDWSPDELATRILSGIKSTRERNGHHEPITVVDGACPVGRGGVDGVFHRVALSLGMRTERHPAVPTWGQWPGAGPRRNEHMVSLGADLGIACHPDLASSKGTLDCARRMVKAGIPVVFHDSDEDPGRLLLPGHRLWALVRPDNKGD